MRGGRAGRLEGGGLRNRNCDWNPDPAGVDGGIALDGDGDDKADGDDKVVSGDSEPARPESALDTLDSRRQLVDPASEDMSKLSRLRDDDILPAPERDEEEKWPPDDRPFKRFPSSADGPTISAYWPISV